MIKAYVEGGVLDKILKTPVGETLWINGPEADLILSSPAARQYDILAGLCQKNECRLFGRTIRVDWTHGPAVPTP